MTGEIFIASLQGSGMARAQNASIAQMFREKDGQVYATGEGLMSGYIEDFGTLTPTLPAERDESKGYYILSNETPTAAQPLVLIGTAPQILDFFAQKSDFGIENRFKELPTIYMIITPYKPVKSRYKVTTPIFGVIKHFTQRLKGAVNTLVDPPQAVKALEGAADGLEFAQKFKKYAAKLKKNLKKQCFMSNSAT